MGSVSQVAQVRYAVKGDASPINYIEMQRSGLMGKFTLDLQSADGRRQAVGLLCALSGLVLAIIGNYIFFLKMHTAYETFPVLSLGCCLSGVAMKLGSKKLGILSIVLSLPAVTISLFIIIFFAQGGSR